MVVNLRVRSGGGLHLSVSTAETEVAWLGLSSISDFTGEYCQTGPILPITVRSCSPIKLDYCEIVVFPSASPVGVTCPKEQLQLFCWEECLACLNSQISLKRDSILPGHSWLNNSRSDLRTNFMFALVLVFREAVVWKSPWRFFLTEFESFNCFCHICHESVPR